MKRIELRKDGWFEAGKYPDPSCLLANLIYPHKQQLKKHLEDIGEVATRRELERALAKIPDIKFFEGKPYLVGDDICIMTDEGMGHCYLGKIKEEYLNSIKN